MARTSPFLTLSPTTALTSLTWKVVEDDGAVLLSVTRYGSDPKERP